MLLCNYDRLDEKIKVFSGFGKEQPFASVSPAGTITRLSLSPAAILARKEIIRRCEKMGMNVSFDDMGNIYAVLSGSEDLPAISSGSHCDSVIHGGNYDGILGVLAALEVIETIYTEKIPHRHPITLLVWTNEEGARFEPAMMSSGVITGKFDQEKMYSSADSDGITFKQALIESGFMGAKENRFSPERYKAFLELHIEQGPVLEAEKIDIGILEGVVGMVNYDITVQGQAGHAGTTPMNYRKDALYAASKIILYLHEELDRLEEGYGSRSLVYTTGRLNVYPGVHTVIPEKVSFSIDIRHKDPEIIKKAVLVIESIPAVIEKCTVESSLSWNRKTALFNKNIVDTNEKNAELLGYSNKRMYSGPGHDAQFVSDIVPTAMIFVPSIGGHSHSELEYTPTEACLKGANVLLNTVLDLDKE